MYRLYYVDSPNVHKISVCLEELGLKYEIVRVDLFKGEQFDPFMLKMNPNNRLPILLDMTPTDGGEPIPVFESGAILIYLAEKHGRLLPTEPRERTKILQWVMWQMSGQGPTLGQAGHFINYALVEQTYALERFQRETRRIYRVLNEHLENREFICDEYSIADIACWPWVIFRDFHHIKLENYPAIERWYRRIESRDAVKRAMGDFKPAPPWNPKSDLKAWKMMFAQE